MKAWELLEKKGWCRGHYTDARGRCCAMEALTRVYYGRSFHKAHEKLLEFTHGRSVIIWNDHIVKNRRQVIAALKAADV